MIKIILIKSPDKWATTKQACRDKLVVYLSFSSHNIIYIYIYIYIYFFFFKKFIGVLNKQLCPWLYGVNVNSDETKCD